MSTRKILLVALMLGFATGFSWVAVTGGPMGGAPLQAASE